MLRGDPAQSQVRLAARRAGMLPHTAGAPNSYIEEVGQYQ